MYSVYLIIVLGMLSAFGPFVIDMYLPAMPEMTRVFSTSVSSVQLGLTFCMVGLAVGQVIFGPLSDKYGRKPVLYFSLLLYIAATLFCCLSQDIDTFNFARLLQGLGGAGALLAVRFSTTAKATYFGTAGSLTASIAGFIFALTTKDLYTYEGCLLLMVFCLGFIFTGATATAMNLGRKYAGAASAIIGSIGFLLGGIVSPIVSLGNIQATSFAVCTVALGLGLLLLRFFTTEIHGSPAKRTPQS